MKQGHNSQTVQRRCEPQMDKHFIQSQGIAQRKTNHRPNTGNNNGNSKTNLPAQLKDGIEGLSGISMDDVKVHYNSDKPTQLNAYAYAQGTDIHLASGQEKHLPHEAWHVVQQKQGRVQPTMQMKGTNVNDNSSLENEADVMGEKALHMSTGTAQLVTQTKSIYTPNIVQGKWAFQDNDFENAIGRGDIEAALQMLGITVWVDRTKAMRVLKDTHDDETQVYSPDALRNLIMGTLEEEGDENSMLEGDDHQDGGDAPAESVIENALDGEWLYLNEPDMGGRIAQRYGSVWQKYDALCRSHGYQANTNSFLLWLDSGIMTRFRFDQFCQQFNAPLEQGQGIKQFKRGAGDSYQKGYKGANGFQYQDITYTRNGKGVFDFASPTKYTKWQNPIMSGSDVDLEKGSKKSGYGLTISGDLVQIAKASRTQHFSIGDRVYKAHKGSYPNRAGTWTWHHLQSKYKMQLVDMTVHAKHGHNGGFLLWN